MFHHFDMLTNCILANSKKQSYERTTMIVIHRNPACFARQSLAWQRFYPRTRSTSDDGCHRFSFESNYHNAEIARPNPTGWESSQQDESFPKKEDAFTFEKPHHRLYVPAHIDEENAIVSISLDIPGFSINDLKVEIERGIIHISGVRTNKLGHKFSFGRHFLFKETRFDADHAMANLSDGVLTISLPRKEEPTSRVVPITSKNASSFVDAKEEALKVASSEEEVADDHGENKQSKTRSDEACAILVETVLEEDGEDEDPQFSVDHEKATTSEKKSSSLEPTVGESDFGAKDTTIDSDASVEEEEETDKAWVDLKNERD